MEVSEITKEIYQDSKNKYLVIQNDIQGQDSIAVNMLKNNDIDGFLRFECRCIDNTEFFYYDITGMTNLSELSKSETFDIKKLKNIFRGIIKAVKSGEEYFISEDMFVIDMDSLYLDKKSNEIKVCCVPEYEGVFLDSIKSFVENLMECIEHEDKQAEKFIYGLYEIIVDEGFVIENICGYISDTVVAGDDKNAVNNELLSLDRDYYLEYTGFEGDNVYKLEENVEIIVGRDEGCQLVIPLCQISRQHAVVRFEGGHIGITDISSVNGTFVNGKKISANVETILKENDVITFADTSLKLISV